MKSNTRWAEEDERYLEWLPCKEGWRKKAEGLVCPNPCCHVALPPFHDLLRQAEHQETLLLLVELLKQAEREAIFLNGLGDDLDLTLQALSRCHHLHTEIIQHLVPRLFTVSATGNPFHHEEGLRAIGHSRLNATLSETLKCCTLALHDDDWAVAFGAATTLGVIGNGRAEKALLETWEHIQDRGGSEAVSWALEQIGEPAVESLIIATTHRYSYIRQIATCILERIGNERAIPGLEKLLDDPSEWVARPARSALKAIRRRSRLERDL